MAAAICALSGIGGVAHGEEAPPQHLSDTGLYVQGSSTEVRPEVLPFSPQYPLWSDGASKRRWIYLPPGTFIDASRPSEWEFPRGTRLWKEFRLERRVETRFIERRADGSWRYATYIWNADETDAVLAAQEASTSLAVNQHRAYVVPSESDCRACHEGPAVPVLGFSALQLSPDRDPLAVHAEPPGVNQVDLRKLVERGVVRNLPTSFIKTPPRISAASPTERAALGYLHGNCGHCHTNPEASDASVPLDLRLAQDLADPASTQKILRSLESDSAQFRAPGTTSAVPLIAPGAAQNSALLMRMRSRNANAQMPPLGTAMPDSEGLALIARWIDHDLHPSTSRE